MKLSTRSGMQKLSSTELNKKKIVRRFFFYQIPVLATGAVLIAWGAHVGIEKDEGLFLFTAGAVAAVLSPLLSLYLILKKYVKKRQ